MATVFPHWTGASALRLMATVFPHWTGASALRLMATVFPHWTGASALRLMATVFAFPSSLYNHQLSIINRQSFRSPGSNRVPASDRG
jgi:hypothetical protein